MANSEKFIFELLKFQVIGSFRTISFISKDGAKPPLSYESPLQTSENSDQTKK